MRPPTALSSTHSLGHTMGDIEKTTDDWKTALSVSSVETHIQRQTPSRRVVLWAGAVISLSLLMTTLTVALYPTAVIYTHKDVDAFYRNITTITDGLCPGINGPGVSHAGHIGLHGDTESHPKRSFFWYVALTLRFSNGHLKKKK